MGVEPMKRFVIDTNALIYLRAKRRNCDFFVENCFIPELVLHEAEGFPDYVMLVSRRIIVNAEILSHVVEIMDRIDHQDNSLVNLYKNQGMADPFVIATALYQQEKEDEQPSLWPIEWVIVSDDKAVKRTASIFNIPCISAGELAEIVDSHSGEN